MQSLQRLDIGRFDSAEIRKNDECRLVLGEEESDPKFGHDPLERPMQQYLKYGFIILDKPAGPTSHEVAAWVRKMFGQERAGYSGTLDPPVSGILPLGLGDGTKALSALLLGPKEYVCVARIHDPVPTEDFEKIVFQFIGPIFQRPPQRSSVKRSTRTREIYQLEVIEKIGNLILLRIMCEAGTYVRKLVYDIGELLIVGATMAELRRTRVCHMIEGDMVRLHDLHEAKSNYDETGNELRLRELIRPIEDSLTFLKQITIRDSAVESICQGAQLAIPGIVSLTKGVVKGEIVRLLSGKGEVVAIAECQLDGNEIESMEHGIAAITKRVIMEAGTYPRMWKSKDETVNQAPDISEQMLQRSLLDSLEKEDQNM